MYNFGIQHLSQNYTLTTELQNGFVGRVFKYDLVATPIAAMGMYATHWTYCLNDLQKKCCTFDLEHFVLKNKPSNKTCRNYICK